MSASEPKWITVLRESCARTSQMRVAEQIGYSDSVVNQVLKGKYKGDLRRVEKAVRGALMHEVVDCPALGFEIKKNQCLHFQGRPFAATSHARAALYKTCPTCEHRQKKKEGA